MIEIDTLSPVHIGNGEEIPPIEYIVEGDSFYRINMDGVFRDKDRFNRQKFLGFVEDAVSTAKTAYFGNFDRDLAKAHQRYKLKMAVGVDENYPPPIKEFIKTSNRFYIPGSSIKGAILSALYWYLLKESCKSNSDIKDIVKACSIKDFNVLLRLQNTDYERFIVTRWNRRYQRKEFQFDQILLNILFEALIKEEEHKGYIKQGKRGIINDIKFAPWLQVTDTNWISAENAYLGVCKVFGSRRNIEVFYELLKPKSKLNFELSIQKTKLELQRILEIVNKFYSRVLEEEKKWCVKNRICISFSTIEDEEYILRLGQGSSSLATSLLILAEDLGVGNEYLRKWRVTRDLTEPKTRKIVFEDGKPTYPLGWVKLEVKNE